jgi:hypothetical protein
MMKEVDRCVRELLLVSYASLVEHKKKPAMSVHCRFHHLLPDARGDHIGQSVHRVNIQYFRMFVQQCQFVCYRVE